MAASAAMSVVNRIGPHEKSFELPEEIMSLHKRGSVADYLWKVTGNKICPILRCDGYFSVIYYFSFKYGCSLAKHFIMKLTRSHFAMIDLSLARPVAYS
jgi:hypothetical protein